MQQAAALPVAAWGVVSCMIFCNSAAAAQVQHAQHQTWVLCKPSCLQESWLLPRYITHCCMSHWPWPAALVHLLLMLQYHERVATMMQQLQHIPLGQLHGQSVALLLGSSVLRPREVYCFSFPASMDEPGGGHSIALAAAVNRSDWLMACLLCLWVQALTVGGMQCVCQSFNMSQHFWAEPVRLATLRSIVPASSQRAQRAAIQSLIDVCCLLAVMPCTKLLASAGACPLPAAI